ncbi:MAG: O-antigen ligase family protein [Gaiellaceae bacterium]
MAAPETFSLRGRTPESLVFLAAVPIIFWHLRYQPKTHFGIGSATVGIELSDVAVLAVIVAAVVCGGRLGFTPLWRGISLWVAIALLFVWIAVGVTHGSGHDGYPWQTHGVTAAKFFEYALLAPAVVLLVRQRADLLLVAYVLVAWSVVATVVGLVQFFGANVFVSGATGGRQLSFLGFHDFGALSAAALACGMVGLAFGPSWVAWVAAVSGALGVVLSGSVAAVIGLGLGAVGLVAIAYLRGEIFPRRLAVVAAVLALTALGVAGQRANELDNVLRLVGIEAERAPQKEVESYAHRAVLVWIGWHIFLDHPVAGAGWEASGDPATFMPHVAEARRQFPDEPALAFPAPNRPYGVQNLYVQFLADLGVVGLLLLLAVFACAVRLAVRARLALALLLTAVAAGVWIAQGIVAGIPLDALTWIGIGLTAQDFGAASGKMAA